MEISWISTRYPRIANDRHGSFRGARRTRAVFSRCHRLFPLVELCFGGGLCEMTGNATPFKIDIPQAQIDDLNE
jgi:hypothetical protein